MKNKLMRFFVAIAHLLIIPVNADIEFESLNTWSECEENIIYSMSKSSIQNVSKYEPILEFPSKYSKPNFPYIKPQELVTYLCAYNDCVAETSAIVHHLNGLKGTNVLLSSQHSYYLSNNTNRNIFCKIEVGLVTHDNKSTIQSGSYTLRHKEIKSASINLRLAYFYSKPGEYKVFAYTKISGGCESSVIDTGSVTIK